MLAPTSKDDGVGYRFNDEVVDEYEEILFEFWINLQ